MYFPIIDVLKENFIAKIPSIVTQWLTDNVDPVGSAVVVDTSLSISGAAADAKITGDELNDLKSDLKNISLSQLTEELQTVLTNAKKQQDCELVLPHNIPIVSGTQLNVYYENILYGRYLKDAFVIRQQDAIAGTYRDNVWQYTPSVTKLTTNGSNFRLYAYNLHDYIQISTHFRFVPKTYASGSYKGIVIGDSKIAMGTLMNTLNDLFSNDGTTNVQFMGTLQTANGVKHEGRSGWSSKNYCEDASYLGSTNAFLYNGAFDFGHYLSANNISTPDFVCINLGTNDIANGLSYASILDYYQTMIDSIHAVSANIKVIIGLTENMCQLQFNYSTNKDKILGFVRSLIEKWDNDTARASKIYLCPLYVNMNLYKDYNFTDVAESERNPELIPVPTDYVHQSAYGFYKNADMMYGTIKYYLGT